MDIAKAQFIRQSITKCFASGHFDEGMKLLEREQAGLPPQVRLECYGNLHYYRHELQEAIKDYEAAITLAPEYLIARYQYLVGTQNEIKGNLVGAFKRYQNAIEIEPTFVDAYIELGGLLGKAGDFEGAVKCCRDAVQLDPNDLAIWHNLKMLLAKLASDDPGRYEQDLASAEAAYERLKKGGKKLPEKRLW